MNTTDFGATIILIHVSATQNEERFGHSLTVLENLLTNPPRLDQAREYSLGILDMAIAGDYSDDTIALLEHLRRKIKLACIKENTK